MRKLFSIHWFKRYETLTVVYRVYFWRFLIYQTEVAHVEMVMTTEPPLRIRVLQWIFQRFCKHAFRKHGRHWQTGYFGDGVAYSQVFRCENCGKEETRHFVFDAFRPLVGNNIHPKSL